jgi:deazaflavin-dependent oxidoreductase (nitroreductase family)
MTVKHGTTNRVGWHAISEHVRYFNKHILNPIMLSWAGRKWSPYAVIRHRGRISGRAYSTPVLARIANEHLVIPLPYGKHVDWCRNILAGNGCFITWKGETYHATAPALLEADEGLLAFPGWIQALLEQTGTEYYLQLRKAAHVPADDPGLEPWAEHRAREQRALMLITGGVAGLVLIGLLLTLRRLAQQRA